MKLFIIITLFLAYGNLQAQCESSFSLADGKEMIYILKDNKEKVRGYQSHKIKEKLDDGTLKIQTTIYNKKRRKDFEYTYEAFCSGDTLFTDGAMVINGELMKKYSGAKIKSKGEKLILPPTPEKGSELPDASFYVITASKGFLSLDVGGFTVDIRNREVIGKETITTPAGTFDCIKIRHENEFGLLITFKTVNEVYYAPGVGMVKIVTYRHDSVVNSMELEEIK